MMMMFIWIVKIWIKMICVVLMTFKNVIYDSNDDFDPAKFLPKLFKQCKKNFPSDLASYLEQKPRNGKNGTESREEKIIASKGRSNERIKEAARSQRVAELS